MKTIEVMLEALKAPGTNFRQIQEAISLGEAELKRRQDAITAVEFWISCNTDKKDAYCALLTLLKEEIK